jgi:succinyl-CoA synthetase beta subunit
MLSKYLSSISSSSNLGEGVDHIVAVIPSTVLDKLPQKYPWLSTEKLVVKPDQLIKRRGKAGLIKLNASW